jgi:hypothetical protein
MDLTNFWFSSGAAGGGGGDPGDPIGQSLRFRGNYNIASFGVTSGTTGASPTGIQPVGVLVLMPTEISAV